MERRLIPRSYHVMSQEHPVRLTPGCKSLRIPGHECTVLCDLPPSTHPPGQLREVSNYPGRQNPNLVNNSTARRRVVQVSVGGLWSANQRPRSSPAILRRFDPAVCATQRNPPARAAPYYMAAAVAVAVAVAPAAGWLMRRCDGLSGWLAPIRCLLLAYHVSGPRCV